ncbi:hypothetical protein Tco_0382965 [Tanacetum coccineum]
MDGARDLDSDSKSPGLRVGGYDWNSTKEKDYRVRVLGAGVTPPLGYDFYGMGMKRNYRKKCPKGRNQQNEGARATRFSGGCEIVAEYRMWSRGALLVVKSPYQLAPLEMSKLSNQPKELQEKGFIQPSHSPWGAPMVFVKKKDGAMRMRECCFSRLILVQRISVQFKSSRALPDTPNDFCASFGDRNKVLGRLVDAVGAVIAYACLTCSMIKPRSSQTSGLLQQPGIPEWKWEKITMDLVMKLPRSNSVD